VNYSFKSTELLIYGWSWKRNQKSLSLYCDLTLWYLGKSEQ